MGVNIAIICDAAYNEKMRFAGYAGMVRCEYNGEEVYETFSAAVFDSLDSTEAELNAIGAGVIRARQIINRHASKWGKDPKVDLIQVASDSKWGIGAFINNERGKEGSNRYRQVMDGLLYHWRKVDPKKYEMIKVRAHIEDNPTPMEALHNQVDKMAGDAKQKAYDAVFSPADERAERYVGVLLPAKVENPEQAHDLTLLGYHLGAEGKHLRLAFEGTMRTANLPEHPFVKGVRLANIDAGRQPDHGLLPLLMTDPKKNPAMDGCIAADRLFARAYLTKDTSQPLPRSFFRTDSGVHSGQAARLLYGPVDKRQFRLEQFDGRLQERSGKVIDLTAGASNKKVKQPSSVSQWINVVAECAKIAPIRGLGAALWEHGLVSGSPLPDHASRLSRALDAGLGALGDDAPKAGAIQSLHAALSNEGFEINLDGVASAYEAHRHHPHRLREALSDAAIHEAQPEPPVQAKRQDEPEAPRAILRLG
jgi:ribonuclease HI